MLGERAYITLIDGTKAGFSRRMAQIAELNDAWKPIGLKEPSLADIRPKAFGEDERKAMNSFVDWAMRHIGIPGVAVAVVQDGRTIFAEGFGVTKAGGSDQVTPQTRFMIGSSTKPLTTLMMARLVDMGRFTWTTPVTEVLPGFALADTEVTQRIEMRHTVCACTGMPRRDLDLIFRFRGVRPEDRIAEMKQMCPTTGFGETFQYSNYLVAAGGYAAAHSYAPNVTLGDAYERAMQDLVFEPLGMGQSSILGIHSPLDAAPHGHTLDGACIPIDPVLEEFADSTAPSGSVWSTVLDMARYVDCELRNGLNERGQQVISEDNLRARRRSAIKIDGKSSYGLGLMLTEEQGLALVTHGGNTLGFSADMAFFPEHGIGMVVLSNLRAANLFLSAVRQRLIEILFGAEARAEALVTSAKKALDDSLASIRQRVRTEPEATAWIQNYVGHYVSEELGAASISQQRDGFRIAFESWSSDLGSEEQSDKSRHIVLISAPFLGAVKLQLTENPDVLLLDGGQTRYRFVRHEDRRG
ncbi:putative beta-lactamase [Acidobacterium capsulatum ATCC 51196]|uniref:Putative beta-lactamase n=2 Tax=Acidobacteriaceae TaxID=204434 RepID=C1F5N1_ACIC5|nr:putative beta-lactamase [Acidobacterium capsulatum ATCC 51196]